MNTIEKYAKVYLKKEIWAIENSPRVLDIPALSVYEKALIYKYSEDGYETANEILRQSKGVKMTTFAKLLLLALNKLPDYKGLVYRNVNLTQMQLNRYQIAFKNNEPLKEYGFMSTSRSVLIAEGYGANTTFRIFSRTGKDIEKIAKFGTYNAAPNEKEILFRANIFFKILEISKANGKTSIIMEEV